MHFSKIVNVQKIHQNGVNMSRQTFSINLSEDQLTHRMAERPQMDVTLSALFLRIIRIYQTN